MKRTVDQIEKTLKHYLELDNVHYGYKVVKIINEKVSTYDGTYPSFEIFYEGFNQRTNSELRKTIQSDIEMYTGLKYGRDYWLGINIFD